MTDEELRDLLAELQQTRGELERVRRAYAVSWRELRALAIQLGKLAEDRLIEVGELREDQRAVRTRQMRIQR